MATCSHIADPSTREGSGLTSRGKKKAGAKGGRICQQNDGKVNEETRATDLKNACIYSGAKKTRGAGSGWVVHRLLKEVSKREESNKRIKKRNTGDVKNLGSLNTSTA